MTTEKVQPWKAAWPPVQQAPSCPGIEYGVAKGDVAVVDGTAANVKPQSQTSTSRAEPKADKNTTTAL
jgi:hypothetical protein